MIEFVLDCSISISWVLVDEDDDYVLKSAPCPFLLDDNKCFAYESRPSACREYPHTNRKNMYQILDLTKSNTFICPAVAEIVENAARDGGCY